MMKNFEVFFFCHRLSNQFCCRRFNLIFFSLIKINERSEDFHIGLADFFLNFFSGKSLKIMMHLI